VIESVLLDDKPEDTASSVFVPAGVSHIAIQYAGISLKSPHKVRYRYRLEGFDHEWVDAGSRRVAFYTNLPPGEYQFQVTAQNGDAVWNRLATSAVLTVAPHFYQTWWFRSLLCIAVALLVYALYLLRVRQVQAQYDAVLKERNRIAREIHDTLAQGFVGVSVQLEIVTRLLDKSTEAARRQLDETRALVRHSIAEARASIWELRSHEAENRDFASRLTNVAKQTASPSGARVQVDVHGVYRPLQPEVEDELLRICQEAVVNAVRHASPSQINIGLTFDSKKVRMTVNDDGCGFSGPVQSDGPAGHFGLKGMRERAERIGAEFSLDSTLGKGTTVSVEAPAK
jgi:signal transduction histidine kinase